MEIRIHKQLYDSVFAMEGLPKVIYKYRHFEGTGHLELISDQIVYFSSPIRFEDPLDCILPVDPTLLAEEDYLKLYLNKSLEKHPHFTINNHLKWAAAWSRQSPMRNKEYVEGVLAQHISDYFKQLGVLSLTAVPNNPDMWETYAHNRSGFCIGFHTKLLFSVTSTGGGEVNYYKELPKLKPLGDRSLERNLQFYSKQEKYDFEQEYRCFKFWDKEVVTEEDRKIKVLPNIFLEIIIGDLISDKNRFKLISLVNEHMPHVKLKAIEWNNGNPQIVDY